MGLGIRLGSKIRLGPRIRWDPRIRLGRILHVIRISPLKYKEKNKYIYIDILVLVIHSDYMCVRVHIYI